MLESFIPSHYQVIVEVGVGVLRRTDGHLGEPDFGDGDRLHGGGHGVLRPVAQALVDDAEGGGEGGGDDGHPEHAPEGPRAGDQGQARDGGALQEVRHQVHTALGTRQSFTPLLWVHEFNCDSYQIHSVDS